MSRSYRAPSVLRPLMISYTTWLREKRRCTKLLAVIAVISLFVLSFAGATSRDVFDISHGQSRVHDIGHLARQLSILLGDWHMCLSVALVAFGAATSWTQDPLNLGTVLRLFFAIFCFDFMMISGQIEWVIHAELRERVARSWIFFWQPGLVCFSTAAAYGNIKWLGKKLFG